jgi:hypothetical protein
MMRMLQRAERQREDGIAMVTAILVSAIILTLSITATSLAIHNTDQSGLDRKRTQVISTAEAGIDVAFSMLQTTPAAQLPCTMTAPNTAFPSQEYTVSLVYYDVAGAPGACTGQSQGGSSPQPTALITSTGNSVPALAPNAKRTMQSKVRMRAVYGGLAQAIFSDNSPTTKNNLTVNGVSSDDANVYTNGSWLCQNPGTVHGAIYAAGTTDGAGSITMANNCQASKDIWAYGAVTMQNSSLVGHNAISSTSSITLLNSAHVLNSAIAGTSISIVGSQAKIDGTQTPNHPQTGPPPQGFPHIAYDSDAQARWTNAGYAFQNFSSCSSAATFIKAVSSSTPKTVVRVTPACAMTLSGGTVNIYNDLAIISDGSIGMSNIVFQSGDGVDHKLQFIVPYTTATTSSCSTGSPANISTSNQTTLSSLQIFLYTPCTIDISNNSAGDGAQLYGGTVKINNQFTLNFQPFYIPGAGGITGYNVDIAYLREIVNP